MEQTPKRDVVMVLTVEEALVALHISRPTFYYLIKSEQLRTIKIGTARRVPLTAIQAFIDAKLLEEQRAS